MIRQLIRLIAILLVQISIISVAFAQVVPDLIFNTLFRTESGGWVAGDGTFSLELPGGRTLWLFGDSFIGTVNPGSSFVQDAKLIRN